MGDSLRPAVQFRPTYLRPALTLAGQEFSRHLAACLNGNRFTCPTFCGAQPDTVIDAKTQTCKVVAEVDNREGMLRAGLAARMEIRASAH